MLSDDDVYIDRHPPTSALSPVLDEMLRLHNRLQPHLLRYRQLMSDDQDYTNRVCILICFSKNLPCFMCYADCRYSFRVCYIGSVDVVLFIIVDELVQAVVMQL